MMFQEGFRGTSRKFHQCNEYIRILGTNTQFSGYEYIPYSYSANVLGTNIFDIHIWSFCNHKYIRYSYSVRNWIMNRFDFRIWSGCEQWIYSIFVFGPQSEHEYIWYSYSVKSFIDMFLFIYPWVNRSLISSCTCKIWTKACFEFSLWWRAVSKVCVFYIRYLYF